MWLQKNIETIVKYLARVHTGSEPNDNIKLANWTPNNGPFSYNFRQFIVQFTFRSREIEFFEKIFRVSALTLCHQGFISLQRFVLPLPLKGQVSILVEISAIYTIKNKSFMQSRTTDTQWRYKSKISAGAAIPKNLGLGLNFRPCSEGYFLSGRP